MTHVFSSKTNCQSANLKTVIIEGETIDTIVPEDTLDVENYSPSLGKCRMEHSGTSLIFLVRSAEGCGYHINAGGEASGQQTAAA